MKKFLALLLALLMVLGLCSCTLSDVTEILEDVGEIIEDLPDPEEPAEPAKPAEPDKPEPAEPSEPSEPEPVEPAEPSEPTEPAEPSEPSEPEEPKITVTEDGQYSSKDEVALYIHLYGHLPSNFITKKQAEKEGWKGGKLKNGKCIGGTYFGNYEGILPEKKGRVYTECDIDTAGKKSRGAKRIVFSNDGLIYYTDDHYETFTLLYGEE